MSIFYLINQMGSSWAKSIVTWLRELWSTVCDCLLHPEGTKSNAGASSLPVLLPNARAIGAGQAPRGPRRPALPTERRGLDCGSLRCRVGETGGASHPSFPARCHGRGRPLWRHSQEACGNLRSPRLLQVLRNVSSDGRSHCGS